jgi:hypothetical protein
VSALGEHVEDYLRLRCALGFQLGLYRQRLLGFLAYLEDAGASKVTVVPLGSRPDPCIAAPPVVRSCPAAAAGRGP